MATGGDAASKAWREMCERLARLGEEVAAAPYPVGDDRRADLLAHLAEQTMCWVGWSVFHADPRRPFFQRQNDLITQWGGPNADNVYRHAPISAGRRYRIAGRMNSCDDWILAIRRGFMHEPVWGTVEQVTAHELGIGPGDEFELLLGGDPPTDPSAHHVVLPEGAAMASFREYYFDWADADPAFMTIECLDSPDEPLPSATAGEVAARLDAAIVGVEHSVRNWNSYLEEHRAKGTDNVMAPPMSVAKGLAEARYAFCFWDLADDEAIVLTSTVPDARYWSFQLYEMGTYELADVVERRCSLNQRQAAIDSDGKVRIVVAHRDPGVPNWLDAGGRQIGQMTYRFFWSNGDPTYTSRTVKLADLGSELPADTPHISTAERAADLAGRRRHLARRFRT